MVAENPLQPPSSLGFPVGDDRAGTRRAPSALHLHIGDKESRQKG